MKSNPPTRRKAAPPGRPKRTFSEALDDLFLQIEAWVIKARENIRRGIDWTANFLFDTTMVGGRFRRWLFIGLGGFLWALTGFINSLPQSRYDNIWDFILYPIPALFAPEVFRHILAAGFSFWLALQIAATYLDDIFELENPEIAERYILQASLANKYPKIEIKQGQIEEKEESTIVRIGGPGLVRVHYDSAGLFEKFDGDPTVILAEDDEIALDRFERLRKVMRLKDHVEETNLQTRTRDGIPISAQGVRVKYFIHRDEQKVREGKIPYPVVRNAVHTLVYGERVRKTIDPISLKALEEQKTDPEVQNETLEIKATPMISKLKKIISNATLSEFLAAISELEMNQRQEDTDKLQEDTTHLTGLQPINIAAPLEDTEEVHFKTRDTITNQVYASNDQKNRFDTGLQLEWIDIGTWVPPRNAEEIARQHHDAWRQSLENLKNRSDSALERTLLESRAKTTRTLLQELVYTFQTSKFKPDEMETVRALLEFYSHKLGQAQEFYRKEPEGHSPLAISKTLGHLGNLLGTFRTPRP